MMEAWQTCLIVLLVNLVYGRDIPVITKHVIKQIDSCPDEGYYFRRDLSPNAVSPGPCYLCFCQNNGTAVCWEREQRRCNVENFHHHRIGRQSRSRRSPVGLSDIFFRDATRDLFNKNSPEECKPFEASYSNGCPPVFDKRLEETCVPFVSSFSDSCPPVDWCIGCTVCDCDANGRWDCHILSFCDGKEKKKKIKASNKFGLSRSGRSKAKKAIKKAKPVTTTKPKINNKKAAKNLPRKPQMKTQKPKKNNKKAAKNLPRKPQMKTQKPKTNKRQGNKKPVTKKPFKKLLRTVKPQPKKPKQDRSKINISKFNVVKRSEPKANNTKPKLVKKYEKKPLTLQRTYMEKLLNPSNNKNETIKLGQKIVSQVMTAVQKLLMKEIHEINKARVQRNALLSGIDCGRKKKIDKSTYNIKSNAAAKNKDKFKRQPNYIVNYTHADGRYKRNILDVSQLEISNVSDTFFNSGKENNSSVIPLEDKKNNITMDNIFYQLTSSPYQDKYYKYITQKNTNLSSNVSSSTEQMESTADLRNSDTFFNLVIPIKSESNESQSRSFLEKSNINKTIHIANPEFNDLKFTKWLIIKTNKGNGKEDAKSLMPRKPLEEIYSTKKTYYTKKQQVSESNTEMTKKRKSEINEIGNNTIPKSNSTSSPIQYHTNVTGLEKVLKSLIKGLNNNNTTRINKQPKINVMKHVRKFFHKIFSKKRTKSDKVYGLGSKEDHTLQILCQNIGSCHINRNNKFILKYKLKQLNKQTASILQSIRIIKGLLHLLDLPYNNITVNAYNRPTTFHNDVQKLNTILKDSYAHTGIDKPLTATQITQINYIKMNTQTFIESVTKFANILSDIIVITKMNIEENRSREPHKSRINDTIVFKKIKNILKRYNLIQNSFITMIYNMVKGLEKKNPSSNSYSTTTEKYVKHIKGTNNDKIIETYSKTILENLNRLKNLAQALSAKRTKRELYVKENALEYLLTLMEYLIKQNHLLDAAPANDGIDFLIDAIKNAPDIKTIKKKVLNYGTVTQLNITNLNDFVNDSNSDSNRISKEINEVKSQEENIIIDQDSKQEEQTTEESGSVTQKVYYKKFNADQTSIDDPTETTSDHNGLTKKRSHEEETKIGFEKFESSINYIKKFNTYTSDIEDEAIERDSHTTDIYDSTTSIPKTEEYTTPNIYIEEKSEQDKTITNTSKEFSSESQDSSSDLKKTKLDWIEASFDKEIREFSDFNSSFSSPKPTLTTPKVTRTTAKITDAVSGISAENDDKSIRSGKKSYKNLKSDEVMKRKQTQFLNSLDYGTEKSDFEEMELNDEDKSNDGSPVYFV